ncbi:MAG TPA: rhomboid family intramembrane serine protease [Planctomycetaceae bacterium]|nr:rhomboid family intramembrane serine protease [Planctomycetaceae bacterium]
MTDRPHGTEISLDAEKREQFIDVMTTLPSMPTMTVLITLANIVVFAVMVASGMDFMQPSAQTLLAWGADFGPRTLNGEWWRMVSCTFLHFGIVHIGMNMLVLWGLGRMTERFVGSVGFVIAYMVSGVAGSIASLAWNPHGISAGASGAVFGVAGTLLGFVVLRRDTMPVEVRGALLKSMAKFLILNSVIGISVAHIDMAAHLGGFFGGVICGLILSQPLATGILAKRKFRNLATCMGASVLLPIGIMALPSAPPDVEAEMQRLGKVEQEIYDLVNTSQDLAAKDIIDDNQFADRIEQQVLPRWSKYSEDIEALSKQKHVNEDYFSRLITYTQLREKSWRVLVEGLREQDRDKLQESRKLTDEANNWFSTN